MLPCSKLAAELDAGVKPQLAWGRAGTCVVRAGEVRCCGDKAYGELPVFTKRPASTEPAAVTG